MTSKDQALLNGGDIEEDIINILIVDDNPKNLLAMKKILSELDIHVLEATSGEEALKIVLRYPVAVVYLDVQMPGMDGYEVARCMNSNVMTSNIPIVFVTAIYNDKAYIQEGYSSGAIDYLSKPVEPYLLLAKTKIFVKLYQQQKRLKETVDALDELANNDPLTGLSNRNQFNYIFEKSLAINARHSRQFALLLLDLDNFKSVNDTLAHDVGDELLKQVSSRLLDCIRESDHLSRLGGDEFALLLTELNNPNDASRIATNIISSLIVPFEIGNHKLTISTSIGVATYPFASKTVKGLFKSADIALYRAKDGGKNKFEYYTESLNETYARRASVESELQKAIEKCEVSLVYQPRVNMRTNEIVGVEALARWNNEKLGYVSPDEFITIAEDSGMMTVLGEHLMQKAFSQIELWEKKHPSFTLSMAINLSPYQVMSQRFSEGLRKILSNYSINLNHIEFELTESFFKGDESFLEKTLNHLKQMGLTFAIDDFGTGYSSLSRLKLLPINVLKIDKSFVRDIMTDVNDAAIVKAIIALADALQLDVVAEGVETKEQVDFLLESGCIHAQGFYYSKAVTPEEIDKLIKKGK